MSRIKHNLKVQVDVPPENLPKVKLLYTEAIEVSDSSEQIRHSHYYQMALLVINLEQHLFHFIFVTLLFQLIRTSTCVWSCLIVQHASEITILRIWMTWSLWRLIELQDLHINHSFVKSSLGMTPSVMTSVKMTIHWLQESIWVWKTGWLQGVTIGLKASWSTWIQ